MWDTSFQGVGQRCPRYSKTIAATTIAFGWSPEHDDKTISLKILYTQVIGHGKIIGID